MKVNELAASSISPGQHLKTLKSLTKTHGEESLLPLYGSCCFAHRYSLSVDGKLVRTILASYAQEEILSVSENCKWRIRKQFENGELVTLRFMFGYHIVKAAWSSTRRTLP